MFVNESSSIADDDIVDVGHFHIEQANQLQHSAEDVVAII